jgi:hypothetical protein
MKDYSPASLATMTTTMRRRWIEDISVVAHPHGDDFY